ncbi:chitinase [Paramyrothecium foliicola]|nr:chitinase [Paramyrothecium foliicola]
MAQAAALSHGTDIKCIMYFTGQHVVAPTSDYYLRGITHINLSFMVSRIFNVDDTPDEFPIFMHVPEARKLFKPETKISVAIGGWGDTGFEDAARNETSRKRFARQVKAMIDLEGADGVDIDWEYPGGNRDDYKQVPNSERVWEIEAFVSLLQELRAAIGRDKLLSIAVPGLERDLMAFTKSTIPRILKEVDWINVMTYDLMNRRDTVIKHHSGIDISKESIRLYMDRGAPAHLLNLGLGYYTKAFLTQDCDPSEILGCPTQLLEDPETGADLGKTAGFSWHDEVPKDLLESFFRARTQGQYFDDGSYGYWDAKEKRWWTYDTPKSIRRKFDDIIKPRKLGGVFAWGLGEDAPAFKHFKATVDEVFDLRDARPKSE